MYNKKDLVERLKRRAAEVCSFGKSLIRNLHGLFRWFEPKARPRALEASTFRKLPPELVLHIISYLPPESAAAFGISCHAFHSWLKIDCLQPLKKVESEVVERFLRLLDRDLPDHLLCLHCYKFHSTSLAKIHLRNRRRSWEREYWLACWQADEYRVQSATHNSFSSTIFRMAMKAYRQGHDTAHLTKLLSYEPKTLSHLGYVTQSFTALRFHDGSLLMRKQEICLIPASQKGTLPWSYGVSICLHIHFPTMKYLYMYGIQVPNADAIEEFENTHGIICCTQCYTEFRIDFKGYGSAGNAMFVTSWRDIGGGHDLSDMKWSSRIQYDAPPLKDPFQRGSICASFEQKADSEFLFDSILTAQNEKQLRRQSTWVTPEKGWPSVAIASPMFMVRDGTFVPL